MWPHVTQAKPPVGVLPPALRWGWTSSPVVSSLDQIQVVAPRLCTAHATMILPWLEDKCIKKIPDSVGV